MFHSGYPIHAEVDSADAHGGVAFTLYKAGSTSSFSLGTAEYLNITDIIFIAAAEGLWEVYADSDAGGRVVAKGKAATEGGLSKTFTTPYVCPVGVTPKLYAAAGCGQVTCVVQGFVTKNPHSDDRSY
jgi:hypothetical protein